MYVNGNLQEKIIIEPFVLLYYIIKLYLWTERKSVFCERSRTLPVRDTGHQHYLIMRLFVQPLIIESDDLDYDYV